MTTVDEQYIFDLSRESNGTIRNEFYRVSNLVDSDEIGIESDSTDSLILYHSKLINEMALRGLKYNRREASKATNSVSERVYDATISGEITLKYVYGTDAKACIHCGEKLFPEDETTLVCSSCHGRQPGWRSINSFTVNNKVGII